MIRLPEELSTDGLQLANDILAQMDQGDLEVPLLPEIAQRVTILINEPNSDALQLAKLIQSDPTLAANVIRIANSAAYSPNASIVSLQQAITRLGMRLLGEVALSASINTRMFHAPGYEARIAEIWKLSQASALWAKEISRTCRLNVETAFLCGLLSSIGRAITLHTACAMAEKKGIQLKPADALLIEESLHHVLGVRAMEIWKMPGIIIEAIGYLAIYNESPKVPDLVRITFGAVQFASHSLAEGDMEIDTLLSLPVFGDLNLYPDDLQQLFAKREDILSTVEAQSL